MDPFPGADAQGAQGHLQQTLGLDGRGHQPVIALEHQGKQRRQRRACAKQRCQLRHTVDGIGQNRRGQIDQSRAAQRYRQTGAETGQNQPFQLPGIILCLGDAGKRLHTGRSRNDQVALDIRLTLRDYSKTLQAYIVELVRVLCKKAAENTASVMPGYTHLQRAQPITFGHALMAYASMLLRDLDRFADATARMDSQCPLGSGALAGTTYPLDRDFTAEKLGFAAPCANSLDGVSDRDFCIELASAISICMMHLSRLSEEIILWCSWEFKFIELDDAFTTGSSIMPQKKNPDVTELIRGKTGRVYGDLNTLLVMMKGLPLAYNKDMQEDKEAIFDAVDTLELCLKTITPMLDTMKTLPANMRRAAAKGFINATDCADYLTKKGMPFRDAYKLTGCMVSDCIAADKTLEELTLTQFQSYSPLFEADIYDAIDLVHCCEGRTSYGGPSAASVEKQIALAAARLDAWEEENA